VTAAVAALSRRSRGEVCPGAQAPRRAPNEDVPGRVAVDIERRGAERKSRAFSCFDCHGTKVREQLGPLNLVACELGAGGRAETVTVRWVNVW